MRRAVRLDLPRRFAQLLPRWLTELLVAVAVTGLFVGIRLMLNPWIGAQAPYSLATLAMVLAVLLAGWRSGAVSLLMGLALIWYFVLPPTESFVLDDQRSILGLGIVTFAETVILAALGIYQREVRAGEIERARRINYLAHALREMDHRTKNNFQIVTSLLALQGAKAVQPEVQTALKEAAERLKAVAAVYDALAPSSQGLATVRLQDQLQEIADQIRRGILPEGIRLEAELAPLLVPHEIAVSIGIIVNELITNACKHAFPEGEGTIRLRTLKVGQAIRLEVADDGRGFTPATQGRKGLGTRLVAAFVQRMGGQAEVHSTAAGTTHAVTVPLRAG